MSSFMIMINKLQEKIVADHTWSFDLGASHMDSYTLQASESAALFICAPDNKLTILRLTFII